MKYFPQNITKDNILSIPNYNNTLCFLISFIQIFDLLFYHKPDMMEIENPSRLFRKLCNFLFERKVTQQKVMKLHKQFLQNVLDPLNQNGHYDILQLFEQIPELDNLSYKITTECLNCGKKKLMENNDNILKLNLPETLESTINLNEIINFNSMEEEVESNCEDGKCDGIKKKKNIIFSNIPDILLIHFIVLNEKDVIKKEIFCEQFVEIFGEKFELIGIVEYFGDGIYGHYKTFVKKSEWFHIDDSKIEKKEVSHKNVSFFVLKKKKQEISTNENIKCSEKTLTNKTNVNDNNMKEKKEENVLEKIPINICNPDKLEIIKLTEQLKEEREKRLNLEKIVEKLEKEKKNIDDFTTLVDFDFNFDLIGEATIPINENDRKEANVTDGHRSIDEDSYAEYGFNNNEDACNINEDENIPIEEAELYSKYLKFF